MVTVYRLPPQLPTPMPASQGATPATACMVWSSSNTQLQGLYTTSGANGARVSSSPVLLQSGTYMPAFPQYSPAKAAKKIAAPSEMPKAKATSPRKAVPDEQWAGSANGVVTFAGHTFEHVRQLGKGSFGVVWEVRETGKEASDAGGALALKGSKPSNQQMLEACLLEAEVIRRLCQALPAEVLAAQRVPRYVAHCVSARAGSGQAGKDANLGRVLLAMSKLDGRPLDQWLYGIDENRMKSISMAELLDGPLPDSQLASRDLAGAGAAAAALVLQMSPVFGSLAGIAYHRDVSAHNFLVRHEAGTEQFALLDFGLAVRAPTWPKEYQARNISGDPRYFSPAAWMLMVYGHRYLEKHPDPSFLEQYKARLDHYSFGVLVLEVFFALWRGSETESDRGLEFSQLDALGRAQTAWRAFWSDSMGFFQLFHNQGFATTRETLARTQALSAFVDRLKALCLALHGAAEAMPGTAAAQVFEVAAGLIDPRGSSTWEELPAMLRSVASPAAGDSVGNEPCFDKADERGTSASIAVCSSTAATGEASSTHASTGQAAASEGCSSAVRDRVRDEEEAANAAGDLPAPRTAKRFSHRRNWTVDEAVSLMRGVPEVGVGWGAPTSPGAQQPAEQPQGA